MSHIFYIDKIIIKLLSLTQRSILLGSGYHKDLDFTKIGLEIMHAGVSKGTVQIAYDWLSKTVYWTDSMFRWIIAAPGERRKLDKDYYKIIVDDHLDAPDGITVDPLEGYLFFLCTSYRF